MPNNRLKPAIIRKIKPRDDPNKIFPILLPDGLETENHLLRTIAVVETVEKAGCHWRAGFLLVIGKTGFRAYTMAGSADYVD